MRKFCFWLITAMLSVYSAEVVSGSFAYPFSSAWGWLVLMPLYGLHMVVLATIVVRRRGNLGTLYLAGMLFGLYEAYITKVLWSSPWGVWPQVAGVGTFEFLLLVVWWHPLMSFIFPLGVAERLLTQSRTVRLPGWPIVLTVAGIFLTWFLAWGNLSMAVRASSLIIGAGVLALPVATWRFLGNHRGLHVESILPGRWAFRASGGALIVLYFVLGAMIAPENFPPLSGQVGILALYGGIGFLLSRRLRFSS